MIKNGYGKNYFIFNGEQSSSYGLYTTGEGVFNSPSRDVTKYSIPGRNGDLVIDNGRFNNITVTFKCFIIGNPDQKTKRIREWLSASHGYHVLEDSYYNDTYRIGRLSTSVDFEMAALYKAGKCDLVFDCKPQRFIKTGDSFLTISSGSSIMNPTMFESKPLLEVTGSGTYNGTITIGNTIITITGATGTFYIDCEMGDAFKTGNVNMNAYITQSFPKLPSGRTSVSYTGISTLRIKPRWWTL